MARGCESMLPGHRRLIYDPWAKHFLPFKYSGFRFLDTLSRASPFGSVAEWQAEVARRAIIRYMDRVYPGGYGFVIARTRYFDDYLEDCLRKGIDQVVILGAGFDARAYRVDALKEGQVKVFEVDQAGTMNRKMKLVRKTLGTLPDHVIYVVINFETDDLGQRLRSSGYDSRGKTLFVWEAVSGYLSPDAVDDVLKFITGGSGEGSHIIFDYPDISFIREPGQSEEAAVLHRFHARIGEPPTFGVDHKQIEAFLSQRGFCDIKSVSAESMGPVYFGAEKTRIRVSPFFHFVHATIRTQAPQY